MKRVTTIILGLAVCLTFSLSGRAAAETIDTIFFDQDRLIIDPASRTIQVQGYDNIAEAGRPDVPAARFFYHADGFALETHLMARVLAADTIRLEFQQSVSSLDIPTSAIGTDPVRQPLLVELNNIYPVNPFLDNRAIQRGQTVWTLTVFPVQYLTDGRIVFNRQIEVAALDAAGKIMVCAGQPEMEENLVSRPFFSPVQSGAQTGGCPLGNDYVIVTSSTLAEAFGPLVDLKRRTGFDPAIALVDSILVAYGGRDAAEAVRSYLHDFYLAGGRFVLLGGDETQVPIRYAYYYNTDSTVDIGHLMICDLYFADFDGEWDFDNDGIWGEPTQDHPDPAPEVALGRLPFSRPEQAAAYIAKLERYLFNPGDGTREYLNRAAFFVSDQMRDYGGTGQQVLVAANFPDGFQTDCATMAESPSGNDPNPSAPSVASAESGLSDGYGLVNILAHGRPDGFVLTSSAYNENPKTYILTGAGNVAHAGFENLARNNKTGFYYSVACDQAAYDLETLYGMQKYGNYSFHQTFCNLFLYYLLNQLIVCEKNIIFIFY
ncbi:MAG: C25 family cysteine peptidase [candidate division Zixibacteria bacterium]|nr:C25 family cysteine peptidase [candidate division Zixibacteria bacterium]